VNECVVCSRRVRFGAGFAEDIAMRAALMALVRPASRSLAIGIVPLRRAGVLDETLSLDVESSREVAAGAELEKRCGHGEWAW
jgi:hypothetical protein